GDRAADFAGDLLVEVERLGAVDLDTDHGASDSSVFLFHGVALTVTTPPRRPDTDHDLERRVADLEALIREARKRARRRRSIYAAIVIAALAAGAWFSFDIGGNGGV